MEKHILALLHNNLRVIIPDFGAFIVRQKEPVVIVFNEFLRYNDGLLIDYLAKTEDIDTEIARQRVADFAAEAMRTVESGKPFAIAGLGVLQMDTGNKIVFSDKPFEAKAKDSPAPAEGYAAEFVKETEEEAKYIVNPKPVVPVEPDGGTKVQPAVNPVPVAAGKSAGKRVDPNQGQKNKMNQILIWLLAFLFANALVLSWFVFRNDIKSWFNRDEAELPQPDSLYEMLADSVIQAAGDTSMVYMEEMAEPEMTVSDPGPADSKTGVSRYYIVAGCFRDEANADELVQNLRSQGFKSEKFGVIGNLHAVCFASFSNKDQAVRELQRIREEVQPEAWMTRF